MLSIKRDRTALSERRRVGRASCRLPAEIVTRTERVAVEVVDISLTGVRLTCRRTLPAAGTLAIPGARIRVLVRRCWRRGELSGWAFLFDAAESARLDAAVPRRIGWSALDRLHT